jgi:hypothetical protein
MALTAMLAKDSADLQAHAAFEFSSGGYHYEIKIKAGESSYSVTDGTNTLKTTLVWAFGSGPVGQTYLFKRVNGEIFEARVSYFDALQGWIYTDARGEFGGGPGVSGGAFCGAGRESTLFVVPRHGFDDCRPV